MVVKIVIYLVISAIVVCLSEDKSRGFILIGTAISSKGQTNSFFLCADLKINIYRHQIESDAKMKTKNNTTVSIIGRD